MALPVRKGYAGAPVTTTLSSLLSAGSTSCVVGAVTGWPSTYPYYIVVEPGTSREEKLKVTGRTSTTLTIVRAQDNTSDVEHAAASTVYVVFTASEADEANQIASAMTTKGDLITTDGTTINRLAVGGTNTHVLQVDSTATNGIKWGQVATAGIADGAVTSAKIADGTIVTADLADGAVTSAKIADGTIVEADLADGAVTSAKILDGTIATNDLADGSITTGKIADSAVTSAKIADGTIVTGDIADSAVTTAKIADSAITTGKIADGTIVDADISASAAISLSKLGSGTAAINISGNAATATTATSAGSATSASTAGYATSAGSATTANSAAQLSSGGQTISLDLGSYKVNGTFSVDANLFTGGYVFSNDLLYFSNTNGGSGTALVHTAAGAIRRQSSLRRLKNSIADFGGAVEKIKKLRPRTFKWNPSPDDVAGDTYAKTVQTSHGFIVEEVMEAVEDLVYFDVAEDGTKTPVMWKQNDVIAILVKAVQELSARVEELESK